jgi:hypothetical protein
MYVACNISIFLCFLQAYYYNCYNYYYYSKRLKFFVNKYIFNICQYLSKIKKIASTK